MWIPKHWFKKIDSVFRELIWRGGSARISLRTLRQPEEKGGLAVPDPYGYFLASQLQQMGGSNRPWEEGVAGSVLWNDIGHDTIVEALEADAFSTKCPTTQLMVKAWVQAKRTLGYTGFAEFSPLWDNNNLKELKKNGTLRGVGPPGYPLPGSGI